ncbi:MAG: CinA family nicotinamide mononucleotide deamidase-related protein [Muribaculaceae bacterium]|nr:CinA family nicotinamide mononucleotide deamidase-related protein [Muribaculaceae bacterium]
MKKNCATVIAIGDELLIGQVTDTNSGVVARTLQPLGLEINYVKVIHDNTDDIIRAVVDALEKSDIVVTSGGLGPTRDDITKAALMTIFGGELVRIPFVEETVRKIFKRRGLTVNQLSLDQALVPSSAIAIPNNYGTAPVMWFEKEGKILVSLPGVPQEFQGAWTDEVLPRLKKRLIPETHFAHRYATVSGITESDLALLLESWENSLNPSLHLAYLPNAPYIRLRLDGHHNDEEKLTKTIDLEFEKLLNLINPYLLFTGDISPANALFELLDQRQLTLSSAESCTGGRIASAITGVPGASRVFKGGVVAYDNSVKTDVLGVSQNNLNEYGAVSQQVVEQMADGVSQVCRTGCSIATSGVAGPTGGTSQKPVGTVWIAVKTPKRIFSKKYFFLGNRERIVQRATLQAIIDLLKELKC